MEIVHAKEMKRIAEDMQLRDLKVTNFLLTHSVVYSKLFL
jgi:hypothetical protein